MNAITVKQPWASLIVEPDLNNIGFGIKPIENRKWRCPYKYIGQRVLIHASKIPVKGLPCEILSSIQYAHVFTAGQLNSLIGPNGAIIGSVEIVNCTINHPSIWAEKSKMCVQPIYNWVLANPIKFDNPIPCKGALSFWEYEGELPTNK